MKRTGWLTHQKTWRRLARLGMVAAFGGLLVAAHAAPALATVPRQLAASTPAPDREPDAGAAAQANAMATTVAVLHWQGEQGSENLARVADVAVKNPQLASAPTIDIAAEQTATANAAATATAVAATAVANSVQATVEARATSAALEAAALAATQEADARAEAAASRATQSAHAMSTSAARANATVVAASVAATMEAEARAAAAVPVPQNNPRGVSPLLFALVPLLGGLLGITFWRSRREPFVLKANPASA